MKRQWLAWLPELLIQHDIVHVVVSPGSRSAPLILHLAADERLKLYKQVDERAAGFIALGMAQYLQKPVVLVCTSGTAVLNYGPALAEAYYQRIPLLVLTADRPPEWIDQADGQTLRQNEVFKNYIRKSFNLPVEINHPDDAWFVLRSLSEAIQKTQFPIPGPVHVNVPLREPLYQLEEKTGLKTNIIQTLRSKRILENEVTEPLIPILKKAEKILILVGLSLPGAISTELLKHLAWNPKILVITDIVSNAYGQPFVSASDDIIAATDENIKYYPDILITIGGPVISKRLKIWLRKHKPQEHWHISDDYEAPDTFQSLTKIIPSEVNYFLKQLSLWIAKDAGDYAVHWHSLATKTRESGQHFINECAFGDFKAQGIISQYIPENSCLHLANSMPVRYAHLLAWPENIKIFSNRGVSGIDGCVSTAAGMAFMTNDFTTVLTGDLAMLYDAHALWNFPMPSKLRIIVFNNGGGGIFHIIDGPGKYPHQQHYFDTPHHLKMDALAQMHKIPYLSASNETELEEALSALYTQEASPVLLEIFTNQQVNLQVYKSFYEYILNK